MKGIDYIKILATNLGNIFSVAEAASYLGRSTYEVSTKLSSLERSGLVKRITRGLYTVVPLDAISKDQPLENMWIIVPEMFSPAYIGGWTATEYWDLTEQVFNDICVMTHKNYQDPKHEVLGVQFYTFHIPEKLNFGHDVAWIQNKKVLISDIHKTILDMLYKPRFGAGIQHVIDCFKSYVQGKTFDPLKLVSYAKKMDNGVMFKRLGFLSETYLGREHDLTQICLGEITKGPSYMDSSDKNGKFVSRWRLYLPTTIQF